MTGCKYRMVYNTLPYWSKYLLADYVPMTGAQEARFSRDFQAFHDWHRKNELPNILALLSDLRQNSTEPLNYNAVARYNDRINERILATLKGLTPTLSHLFSTLSDEQVAYLMKKVKEDVAESRERRAGRSESEAINHWSSKMEKQAKFWLNDIDDRQQRLFREIAGYYLEMLPLFEGVTDSRLSGLESLLATRKEPGLQVRLNRYFDELVLLKFEDKKALQLYFVRRNEVLLRMDKHLSLQQRQTFREHLASLSSDINKLIND
ncbi:DUF6279 family lipoprotein [Veronia nyctiphanis]|uniref:DUF6279 family lipoprotein n=1 Tax=Veronia nyctiphanis TaxID=1278244 RepID=UPI0011AE603A|nr:DUF6279 family lipoprotein [Veronia nyctiphanis]